MQLTFLSKKEDLTYEEDTLLQLAKKVEDLTQAGVKINDIAILVRKNNLIPLIADYFDKQTPYRIVSDEAFRLDASLAICILMDALRYLVEPENRIAQAQLASAYQNEVLKNDIDLNTLLLDNLDNYLPEEFLQQANKLRLMPLFELLEKLSNLFQISLIEAQDAYLFAFYDSVSEYLQKYSSELTAFIAYWEEKLCRKSIPSGEVDGIRILSIHKSKGLEFHTVLLPFCDWKLENERLSYLWCTPQKAPFNELPLLPINYGQSMNESIYQEDYRKEKLQLWVDNLNLLYVAFTRPKCNLVVWCKDGLTNTVSELLGSAVIKTSCKAEESTDDCIYQWGEVLPSKVPGQKKTTINRLNIKPEGLPIKMESIETNIEFKQSNRSASFINGEESATDKYIHQGQILHTLFSCLRTEKDIPNALQRLRMEGIIESDEQECRIQKLTEWALGHPMVKEWFSSKWKLYNECAIVYRKNGSTEIRRPDRVMMKDGEVIVVDFKFGKPQPEYRRQVKEYMDLLGNMGYDHIRGYLWYVYNNELEEIK